MLEHWLWLSHRPGINEHTKVLLLQSVGSPEGVFTAEQKDLDGIPGLTSSGRKALEDKNLEPYRAALEFCRKQGVHILTYLDEAYPRRLKNIYDPPLVLYYKGKFPNFDAFPAIGVVGTRHCSAYGASVAGQFGREISSCGGLVVSGLAEGIDAAAMQGALEADCPTVGVLGTGADVVFPKVNQELYCRVEEQGCILSEFLPGTGAFKWNFPRRNRIISGLSLAVVIVEAPEKSGALHTARAALDQNRDVYVVPGNVDLPTFAGSNRLLREGACPVCRGWDVMSEYTSIFPDKIRKALCDAPDGERVTPRPVGAVPCGPAEKAKEPVPRKTLEKEKCGASPDFKTKRPGLNPEEAAIADCLLEGEKTVDEVIAATGIPSGVLLRRLTMLELRGILVRRPGNRIGLKQ